MLVVLGLAALFTLFAEQTWVSGQQPLHDTVSGADKTGSQNKPAKDSPSIINKTTTFYTSEESPDIKKQSDNKRDADLWIIRFTGLLAFVALLQLAALVWQVLSTRRATEIELRAYVFPEDVSRFDDNGTWKFKVGYRNTGKTPAHNFRHWALEGITPHRNPPKPPEVPEEIKAAYIAPGVQVQSIEDALSVSPGDKTAVESGKSFFFAIGELSYEDVFRKKHTTGFRFILTGPNFDSAIFVFDGDENQAT